MNKKMNKFMIGDRLFALLSSINYKYDKYVLMSSETYEYLKSQVQQYVISDVKEYTTICGMPIVTAPVSFGSVYVLEY